VIDRAIHRLLAPTATLWGHSRWATLERCPREYALKYLLGVRLRDTSYPLMLGTAMHRGLAATYLFSSKNPKVKPLDIIDLGTEPAAVKGEAKRLVHAHNVYWEDRPQGWDDVVAVEKLVSGVINGVPFTTRFDLIARKKRLIRVHLPIFVDHKSASRIRGDAVSEFSASGQFLGQLALWKEKYPGGPTPQVLVNRIVKTAVPLFDRLSIPIHPDAPKRFARDLKALHSDMKRYERSDYWPRNYSACVGRYGLCDMFNLCHNGGPTRAGDYRVPKGVNLREALR
jgi:hypothetical protein